MIDGIKSYAPRNKTATLSDSEMALYSERLMTFDSNSPLNLEMIVNSTINCDLHNVLQLLPVQFADLIILDPPYNLSRNFNGFKFKELSDKDYLDYLRSFFPEVVKRLKPDGSLYFCGDWRCTAALQQVMEENLTIINRITWQREKGRGASRNWKNSMEDIWFGVADEKNYYFDLEAVKQKRKVITPYRENGKPKDWEATVDGNFRLTHPSNFWDDISIPFWSMPENTDHPTQKPEKLLAKLILASCPENGIVFDPFLGSGTSSVTAKKLGRRYVGVEINCEYCCLAEKRLAAAEMNKTIQGYAGGVFWERNTANLQKMK
ncbi:MAG: site-specific DNA-methyltransferase [Dysgonamonadaceae bacterium]|jgi:site-specific DNA-methyltransferase (adenine-specific)|nr:site-specific DNA-methyltransferase [Dysgonamonadaceae bacterium]